jgi:O-antigen/teichoic acid export membrane protein
MSTTKLLLSSSAINLSGHFFLLLISFFSLPIILNSLGTASFGKYLLLIGIPALAGLIDFGFGNGSIYYLAKKTRLTFWPSLLGGNLVLTVAMALFGGLLTYFLIDPSLALVMMFLVVLNQLSDMILALAQGLNNYRVYNLKVVIAGLGNTLFSAVVAYYTGSLFLIILTQIAFHLLVVIVLMIWLKRVGFWLRPNLNLSNIKQVIRYGFATYGTTVASQLQNQASRYYLSYIFSASLTGIYGLAQSLIQKGLAVLQVAGRSLLPTSANLADEGKKSTVRKLFLFSIILTLAAGFFAVFLTHNYGLALLTWWLRDIEIAQAVYPILVVLSYWFVGVSLTPLTSLIGMGVGQAKLVSNFAVSSVVVELTLMLAITPQLGVIGPAYAALISTYLHVPLFLYILWQRLK